MKITLITVGKIKEKYLKDGIAEYSKRLSRYCKLEIIEVADEKTPDEPSKAQRLQILKKEGERLQMPPIYSAKKIEGTRAYEFARAGEEVALRQSLITIHEIELLECRLPDLKIRVRCSKGTYIRSLAREIGEALHSGAHLTSLRRTRSGNFTVEACWSLDDFLKKLHEVETK